MAEFRRSPHGRHGYPQSSMFDQPELERVFRDALARHPECELRGGVEVTGVGPDSTGPVRVTYRADDGEHELWADAVLGCDGAGSLTREAIGGVWEDLRFEERWTVIDAETTGPVRCWEGVDQVCDPQRPGTFMRVNDTRYRWEFRIGEGRETVRELIAPGFRPRTTGTSRSSARRSTPSGPASPTAGAADGSSCSATPPTSPRRSSDRVCARGCGMPTTSPGNSPGYSNRAATNGCWTPMRANAGRTPGMWSASRSPWAGP